MTDEQPQAPPAGEEIHLPGTDDPAVRDGDRDHPYRDRHDDHVVFLGRREIIFVVTLLMWIRDTRRDIDELPEDHSAH